METCREQHTLACPLATSRRLGLAKTEKSLKACWRKRTAWLAPLSPKPRVLYFLKKGSLFHEGPLNAVGNQRSCALEPTTAEQFSRAGALAGGVGEVFALRGQGNSVSRFIALISHTATQVIPCFNPP